MHRFRRQASPEEICTRGLWRYSRHPNYLGEILMWWGVFLMLYSVDVSYWRTGIGAFANTLLFLFISIPLMEKRQLSNKPGYEAYLRETSMLIPMSPAFYQRMARSTKSRVQADGTS
jgi:steroid 5-alpha reductase family enzyme